MNKKIIRFVLCMFLSVCTVCLPHTSVFQDVHAAGEKQAAIYGWYDQDLAYQVLDIVNARRKENGLSELTMDEDLLSAAMMRAAETTIYFSHTRPNGEQCFSACEKMFGENIAWGTSTAADTMELWMNSSGHRANILNSNFSSIGIGVFWFNGRYYWVQCFGAYYEAAPVVSEYQGYGVASFPVAGQFAQTSLGTPGLTIVKSKTDAPVIMLNGNVQMHLSAYNWSSDNTTIATVSENGVITGVSSGTTSVTAVNKLDSNDVFHITVTVVDGMWKQDANGWWYDQGDSYPRGEIKEINGHTYGFNNDGYMQIGWTQIKNDWYFFDENGYMKTNAWQDNYWLGENGVMVKNAWVDNNQYYVGPDGKWIPDYAKPKWKQDAVGWWYDNGDGTYPKSEFKTIEGTVYYFKANGYMATGWQHINGSWYVFDNSGDMKKNAWEGNYWLGEDGVMVTNAWVDNNQYYVGSDGKWIEGYGKPKWVQDAVGWWYDNGDGSYPINEFKTILGADYYFKPDGYMATGWVKVADEWYFLTASGAMKKNAWEGNYWLKADGKMAKSEWVDNDKYYVGPDGAWVPGYNKQ